MLFDHALRIRRSIRSNICVNCDKRPAGSDKWAAEVHRPCELECTVFNNVPKLAQIVELAEGDANVDLAAAIRDGICIDCHTCQKPLDQRFYACSCALRMNHQKVTGLIEAIVMPACGCD
jgi:hypothetical protein